MSGKQGRKWIVQYTAAAAAAGGGGGGGSD